MVTRWSNPRAAAPRRFRPECEPLENRCVPSTAYLATDLVSDQAGVAPVQDKTLVNAWGISLSPTGGAFWVSANGSDLSELYTGDVHGSAIGQPFKVAIDGGAPTGQVFNSTNGDFVIPGTTKPAVFIFASESGNITAWNPAVPPPPLSKMAGVAANVPDAVFKGLALASNQSGNFLFATDFHGGQVDMFDGHFNLAGSFTDPSLTARGYAPFGITAINNKLYVSFALQNDEKHDDVAGPGHGFIDVFDSNGHLLQRLASGGVLNSPWGMVQAPSNFGDFSNALLVGNFGDGHINAFSLGGKFLGQLSSAPGRPVVIDGLWGLAFGNGVTAGDANALYYAAGPGGEQHGLFGRITANAAGTNPVTVTESTQGDLVVTGSRGDDNIRVALAPGGQTVVVYAGGQIIGTFDYASLRSIRVNGFAGNDRIEVDPSIGVNAVLDGGAGNDFLLGGGGNDILLGGPGNDLLIARGGRSILIGGDGQDVLVGGPKDDILIGGTTAYDTNIPALQQILAVWTSADSYNNRVAAIRAGANGVPKLDSTTVFDDGVRDFLFGGPGLDWFFALPPDLLLDRLPAEQVN